MQNIRFSFEENWRNEYSAFHDKCIFNFGSFLFVSAMLPLNFAKEQIVTLKQKNLKSIFFILRKWQKNNCHSDNFSTIAHKLAILGHKRGNLVYFENV